MANSNPRIRPLPQCRPKLLKDYLNDNEHHNLLPKNIVLKRSKSKATSTTILAIHKASEMFIKTLKYLPFASIKSPSILPRSISRRLSSKRRSYDKNDQIEMVNVNVKVKVKDILRWRSSRDLVNATTSESTISSPMSSKSSSWGDSDFMADDFPPWCHALPEKATNGSSQGGAGDDVILEKSRTMSMDYSKGNSQIDEDDEQYTPVSVLDTPFQEHEYSSFHLSLDNLQRRKCALMEMIREFEGLSEVKSTTIEHNEFSIDEQEGEVNEADEEKAKKLLNYFKQTCSSECYGHAQDSLLLDFFMHEHSTSRGKKDENFDGEIIKSAHDWLSGMHGGLFEWEKEGNRISYIKDMEKGLNWNKFEEEQEEMALHVEKLIFSSLVDEILIDLL